MTRRDPIPTQSTLLDRIRDPDDAEGWAEFTRIYGGFIRRLALRSRLTESEADDVVQDVFIGICRNINKFQYDRERCSFKHWLSQLVQWRIRDRLKKRLPTSEIPGSPVVEPGQGIEEIPDSAMPELEAVWETEWKENLVRLATDRLRLEVSSKQFQIFFLGVLNGMPTGDVMRRLNVSRGQVYLAKLRVGRVFRRLLSSLESEDGLTGPPGLIVPLRSPDRSASPSC